MRDDGENLGRARLDELGRGEPDRAARVGHVVDEDGNLADDRADEDHARLRACGRFRAGPRGAVSKERR